MTYCAEAFCGDVDLGIARLVDRGGPDYGPDFHYHNRSISDIRRLYFIRTGCVAVDSESAGATSVSNGSWPQPLSIPRVT